MAFHCPSCLRKLSDSADPAEPPVFCMYCGFRLRSSDGAAAAPVMPDPPGTSGDETNAYIPEAMPAEPAEVPLKSIGGYRLIRFIGAGGMGSVYEAEHETNGQRVAVKLLSGRLASNPSSVERFRLEGRVASQITHPNCVFVLGADADVGRPYIVMELMPGQTLKDMVDQKGPLSVVGAVGRILDVIDGLAEAHRLGVIHRDVKPSNCFLTDDDRVKVGDFGLSKSLVADSGEKPHLTSTGAFLGTVLYASPEQIRGEPVGYDSDVYAVCATLYYLLTGRAPYQHESITAALAKAVSEPPPPIRGRRPDVPRELERVVLRGLDRSRDYRWQSVQELRDALQDVRPDTQRPARPRNMSLAYLLDMFLIAVIGTLFGLLREGLSELHDSFNLSSLDWIDLIVTVLYFGLFEGLLGWTPGKRLLRMRVARLGETGPPGLLRGLLRTIAFPGLWVMAFAMANELGGGLYATGFRGVGIVAGCIALAYQLQRSVHGYRGIHDRISGCRVVQRPLPAPRVRLTSSFPNPLDRVQPSPVQLPATVGGFAISGKLCELADGGEVWVGEDKSLGRRVLLRVLATGRDDDLAEESPITRPTRLRQIGHGVIPWANEARAWIAYVAPAGAPLVDVVNPIRPLNWATTRPLLEQIASELGAAECDGPAAWRPAVEQVWVEPNGRLQILEFPIPTGSRGPALTRLPKSADAIAHVRQVASLALEGQPRHNAGRVHAPLPVSASRITDRLFGVDGEGYDDLPPFVADLAESHAHPTQVTAGMRAAHVGVQSVLQALGLFTMLLLTASFSLMMAWINLNQAHSSEDLRDLVADPVALGQIRQRAEHIRSGDPENADRFLAATSPEEVPRTLERLDRMAAQNRTESDSARTYLTRPERSLIEVYERDRVVRQYSQNAQGIYALNNQLAMEKTSEVQDRSMIRTSMAMGFAVWIVVWPFVWAAFAFVFRGGLAFSLAGVALVRSDGSKAGRFRCAARELVLWLPFTVLLLANLWVQSAFPAMTATRVVLLLIAVVLLPVYAAVAIRFPTRSPQDRIMDTSLVPR